jgi:hypothetical protein
MKNLQTFDEFLNENKLNESTLSDIKDDLYNNGFRDSYPHSNYTMVQYDDSKGTNWQIYLNPKKPDQVMTLRRNKKGTIMADGLIGNFVGGKGKYRAFSFKSPEDLKNKLENWKDK